MSRASSPSARPLVGATLAVALTLGRAPDARAQMQVLADATSDAAEPLALDYAAPEECPTADSFFAEITGRTPRARAAAAGETSRVLHVRLSRASEGDGHVGTLVIEDSNGAGTARPMAGGTCAEVAGALALVAALAVDPRASVAPRGSPPPAPPPPTAAPALAPARVLAREPTPVPASASPPASAPARRARFAIGAATELAMIADATVSLRLFGDLELSRDAAPEEVLAPTFRVAIARSLDRDLVRASTTATLSWTQASIDVCPIRVTLVANVVARPCLAGSAGLLHADANVSRTRPWATVGAHGRIVWAPTAWLGVELEAGAIAPLYRESFFFEPSVAVYEAPAAAFVGRLGMALRFP